MMRRLSTHSESFDQELNDLLSFSEDDQTAIEKTVISILKEVRIEGDDAVIRHTNQFDRLTARTIADLQITADQLNEARKQLPLEQLEALENAAMRVRSYHERQMRESGCKSWEYTEPDWEEFKRVINGGGPCNAERLAVRRNAEERGRWVREALNTADSKYMVPLA